MFTSGVLQYYLLLPSYNILLEGRSVLLPVDWTSVLMCETKSVLEMLASIMSTEEECSKDEDVITTSVYVTSATTAADCHAPYTNLHLKDRHRCICAELAAVT